MQITNYMPVKIYLLISTLFLFYGLEANDENKEIEITCIPFSQELLRELISETNQRFNTKIELSEEANQILDLALDLRGDLKKKVTVSFFLNNIITVLNEEYKKNLNWYTTDGKTFFIIVGKVPENILPKNQYKKNDEYVFLHRIKKDDLDGVKELLDKHIDPNSKYYDSWTGVMTTAANGNDEILGVLIRRGGDVNIQADNGYTALIASVINNLLTTTQILLANNANPNFIDEFNNTALDYAKTIKNDEMIKILKSYGAKTAAELHRLKDNEKKIRNGRNFWRRPSESGLSPEEELPPQ